MEVVTRFNVCSVDKVDFLKIIQKARNEEINTKNVLTAWRATGLVPYNPSSVLQKLTNKQSALRKTDSIITTTTTTTNINSSHPNTQTTLQNSHEIENIPANIDQINQLIRRI